MVDASLLISKESVWDWSIFLVLHLLSSTRSHLIAGVVALFLARPFALPTVPFFWRDQEKTRCTEPGYTLQLFTVLVLKWGVWVYNVGGAVHQWQINDTHQSISGIACRVGHSIIVCLTDGAVTDRQQYNPSLGIRWYLDAQMLPDHSLYFELLLVAQPVVCCWIIYNFLRPYNSAIAVSKHCEFGDNMNRKLIAFVYYRQTLLHVRQHYSSGN
jgi:hypothetical protein